MRRSQVILVGAVATVSLAGVGSAIGTSAELTQRPPATLSNLRVCPYESFSHSLHRCTRDFRASVLTSNRFACSIAVLLRRRVQIHGRLTYEGLTQFTATSGALPPGSYRSSIATNIKMNQPLPGGAWACAFSVDGVRRTAAFRSGGPTGPVVDLVACPAAHAIHVGLELICPSDQSSSIPSSDFVVCNGLYVGQRGKTESIDLLSSGTIIAAGLDNLVDAPVWLAYQRFNPQAAGDYSCRFSVRGAPLADKTFRVSGQPANG
jgi:hypothetical protein